MQYTPMTPLDICNIHQWRPWAYASGSLLLFFEKPLWGKIIKDVKDVCMQYTPMTTLDIRNIHQWRLISTITRFPGLNDIIVITMLRGLHGCIITPPGGLYCAGGSLMKTWAPKSTSRASCLPVPSQKTLRFKVSPWSKINLSFNELPDIGNTVLRSCRTITWLFDYKSSQHN